MIVLVKIYSNAIIKETQNELFEEKVLDAWCLEPKKLYNDNIAYVVKVDHYHMKKFKLSLNDVKLYHFLNEHQSKICDKSYILGSIFDFSKLSHFKLKFDICKHERDRFEFHFAHALATRPVKFFTK